MRAFMEHTYLNKTAKMLVGFCCAPKCFWSFQNHWSVQHRWTKLKKPLPWFFILQSCVDLSDSDPWDHGHHCWVQAIKALFNTKYEKIKSNILVIAESRSEAQAESFLSCMESCGAQPKNMLSLTLLSLFMNERANIACCCKDMDQER